MYSGYHRNLGGVCGNVWDIAFSNRKISFPFSHLAKLDSIWLSLEVSCVPQHISLLYLCLFWSNPFLFLPFPFSFCCMHLWQCGILAALKWGQLTGWLFGPQGRAGHKKRRRSLGHLCCERTVVWASPCASELQLLFFELRRMRWEIKSFSEVS